MRRNSRRRRSNVWCQGFGLRKWDNIVCIFGREAGEAPKCDGSRGGRGNTIVKKIAIWQYIHGDPRTLTSRRCQQPKVQPGSGVCATCDTTAKPAVTTKTNARFFSIHQCERMASRSSNIDKISLLSSLNHLPIRTFDLAIRQSASMCRHRCLCALPR